MSGAQPMRRPSRSASRASARRLVVGDRERLLGVDVLAGRERLPRDRDVRERRREVEDHVDRRIGDQLVHAHDREAAGLAERVRLRAVEIGAGDELEGIERGRVLDVCAADHAAPDDPDVHATSPSIVITAASERRASSSSEPSVSSCSTISHSAPGLHGRRHDALVAHGAVADRAVGVRAARAEVLDVHERAASEERDRILAGVPGPARIELEEDARRQAIEEALLDLGIVVVVPELEAALGGGRGRRSRSARASRCRAPRDRPS